MRLIRGRELKKAKQRYIFANFHLSYGDCLAKRNPKEHHLRKQLLIFILVFCSLDNLKGGGGGAETSFR